MPTEVPVSVRTTLPNLLARLESFTQVPISKDHAFEVADNADKVLQNQEVNHMLSRIYGPEMDRMRMPEKEDNATNLFYGLLNQSLDPGLRRDVSTSFDYRKQDSQENLHMENYAEAGVPILSRSALIGTVVKEMDKPENKDMKVQLGLIDLEDLRGADFKPDAEHAHKSADVIVNKSARALRSAFKEAWDELGLHDLKAQYEIGRYGGDEFVFALMGEVSDEHKAVIVRKIQEKLLSQKGYYKEYDAAKKEFYNVERPIKLKQFEEGCVEWIDFDAPSNAEKIMKLDYFKRGLILSEAEFKKVKEKYTYKGLFDLASYYVDYPPGNDSFYPEEVKTLQQKVAYIEQQHPEFGLYFEVAKLFDTEAKDEVVRIAAGQSPTRQEAVLDILENSLFDRMLMEPTYSRIDFQYHLNNHDFDSVHVFDLKFVKEMNDNMTYADADNEIKALWQKIKNTLGKEDRKKVIVSRFGGTFLVGVRKGETLTHESDLEHLNSLDVFFDGGKPIEVPIGVSQYSTKDTKPPNTGEILSSAELSFYRTFVLDIFKEEAKSIRMGENPSFIESMMAATPRPSTEKGPKSLSKKELYSAFLKGKRTLERSMQVDFALRYLQYDTVRHLLQSEGFGDELLRNSYTRSTAILGNIIDEAEKKNKRK